MEITLRQLFNSIQEETPAGFQPGALHRLAGAKFPAKTAYKIAKIAAECEREVGHIETQRRAILARFDEAQNGAGDWRMDAEKMKAFSQEYQEMLDLNVTISGDQLPLADFGDAMISPRDMMALSWLIQDETPKPTA
jgi:hypothetical protein